MITQKTNRKSLYEQDILRWVEQTVAQLKARDFEAVDWENVIEEIEALGIAQKRELVSRLTTLIEHLLKRRYVPLPENYRGWENTIDEQQLQIELLLEDAPSLKSIWEQSFDRSWTLAIRRVKANYSTLYFPDQWSGDRGIDTLLKEQFNP